MTPPHTRASSFTDVGVPDDLIDALAGRGIAKPFPIQARTIPPALAGRDVSGRAPTGSGKTLAFGIPLVANVERARPKRPRALVLVPTRELAAQVCRDLEWLGASRGVRVHAFYGGTKFEGQVKALRRGVDIAVACPGRLKDLIDQGIARLDGVDLVVVDEADRMADMGFLPEVRRLVDQTDAGRQTLLFSATLDGDVDELVQRYQHDPVRIDVVPDVVESRLEHHFWSVRHADRVATTAAVIRRVGPTVVFTRTRYGADRVARQLVQTGVEAVAIHGNRTQNQRERALRAFRNGDAQALVATDVAARGIHVDDVACVVHFDLPTDPKDYVHRSGRTGRAGATGIVVALAMPDRRKDTTKLLRELNLGLDVVEPDVDALPLGAPFEPKRSRRAGKRPPSMGAADRERRGHRSPARKPSGKTPKRRAQSPEDTKPGRAKRTTSHGRAGTAPHVSGGRAKARSKSSRRGEGPDKAAGPSDRTRFTGPRDSESRHERTGASAPSDGRTDHRGTGPRKSNSSGAARRSEKLRTSGSKPSGSAARKAKPARNKKRSGGPKRSGKNRGPSH